MQEGFVRVHRDLPPTRFWSYGDQFPGPTIETTSGRGIYVAPSADFVPFFYTPLYPAVLAGLAKIGLPLGFPLGRAISALATFATMGMLYAIGAREAGRVWGVLAACLYASLFR